MKLTRPGTFSTPFRSLLFKLQTGNCSNQQEAEEPSSRLFPGTAEKSCNLDESEYSVMRGEEDAWVFCSSQLHCRVGGGYARLQSARWRIDKFRQLLLTYSPVFYLQIWSPPLRTDGCEGVKIINIKPNDSNQNDEPVKLTDARFHQVKQRFESVSGSSYWFIRKQKIKAGTTLTIN